MSKFQGDETNGGLSTLLLGGSFEQLGYKIKNDPLV